MDKKHLELLDFLLVKLCNEKPSGIMFRLILTDYKQLTNIEFNYDEKNNFIALYENIYFTKENIDRLKITQSARQIINDHGSLTEYFKFHELQKLQEFQELQQKQEKEENLENLNRQEIQDIKLVVDSHSLSKSPKPKSIINRLAENSIIQIMSILVIIYSFFKIIEVIFCIDIPII
ncbi:MAG: hypothetical protein Q8S54_01815 [Bacteroidota bacterium]|nr:hypothetical protein [Bacteroidota bacterium]